MTEPCTDLTPNDVERLEQLVGVLASMARESAFGRGWVVGRLAQGRSVAELETIVAAADLAISRQADAERGRRRPSVTEIDDAP